MEADPIENGQLNGQDPYADVQQYDQTQTQTQTQQETQSSQPPDIEEAAKSWGWLKSYKDPNKDIYLHYDMASYTIGRLPGHNDIVMDTKKITGVKHCVITWDRVSDIRSGVTVTDFSTNGTWINGQLIGKNMTRLLKDRSHIAFGMSNPVLDVDDFRYIFRFLAADAPLEGIHKVYDIGHEIGKGTFASVFYAIHRETGRAYAIKTIQRARFRAKNQNIEEKFIREISILKSLDHPNICKLKDLHENVDIYHLVLEFIEGGDLLDRILKTRGLSEEMSRHITYQICLALSYIHSKGIAHRDLKPENILLTNDDPPVVKVADFGLAKAVHSMTQFRTMCGTPHYLAPEIVLRDRPDDGYTALVDSYSVGVIVFTMMANALPFFEDETLSREDRVRARIFDWDPLRYQVGVNNVVIAFIARLVNENPADRMSLTEALYHDWLLPLSNGYMTNVDPYANVSPQNSFQNEVGDQPMAIDGGVGSSTFGQNVPLASMEGIDVPGAFPSSQTIKALDRRINEMSQGADEVDISFDLEVPSDAEPSSSAATIKAKGKKRGVSAEMDSDSSLTPVSEDDNNANDEGTSRGNKGRGKKRGRPNPANGKGLAVAAPGRKLRSAKRAAEPEEEEMEVENQPPRTAQRVTRHSPRFASPQKRI